MATLLKIEDIHKTFEAGTVNENHVLKGLDLTVEEGDFISVIGGNGAGKSTLMNILAGGLQVDQGDILLEGKSIKQTSGESPQSGYAILIRGTTAGPYFGHGSFSQTETLASG